MRIPNIFLLPDYNYKRKDHRSFTAKGTELPQFLAGKKNNAIPMDQKESSCKKEFQKSTLKNQAWVMCRRMNTKDEVMVSAWSAFQKETTFKLSKSVNVGYLPSLIAPPTDMNVILAIMDRTIDCMNELDLDYIFLEVDQAIYNKVLQVLFKYHQEGSQKFEKLIVRMGGFHVIICLLRTIYSRFQDSGFIELLVEVGIGTEGTIRAAMKASDVKQGIRYYKLLYEALVRSKMEYFSQNNNHLPDQDESIKSLQALTTIATESLTPENIDTILNHPDMKVLENAKGNMAKWVESFIDMVDLLLNIIHFQRTGNWEGYLQALDEFIPWCFALNRHNYARNLSYHYLDMKNLEERIPAAYDVLKDGGFTGSLSGLKHTQIPMDQIIEMTINRFSKETGGLSGITESSGASERWMRINHFLAVLKHHLASKIRHREGSGHVEFSSIRMQKDEDDVKAVVNGLFTWIPDLWKDDQPIVNISNGKVASNEMMENVLLAKQTGIMAREEFVQRFTSDKEAKNKMTYNDPIKRHPVYTFSKLDAKKKAMSIPEDECQSFGNILASYDTLKLDLKCIVHWPVTSKPWSICNEKGSSRATTKSLFRNGLQQESPVKATTLVPSDIECCIVDAMRVVRMLPISNLKTKTFLAWTEKFTGYLKSLPGTTVHVVFDNYDSSSDIINLSKGRIQSGKERKITDLSQKLPQSNEWADFLTNDSNKLQLTHLLADHLIQCDIGKEIFVTKGEKCYHSSGDIVLEVTELESLQKEADPRLALHTVYASFYHSGVCTVADDTDVFILLLFLADRCVSQLYFRQGTQSSKEGVTYHDVKSLANHLGSNVCKNLPGFHALTGCDYTNPFYGRSKYGSYKQMLKKPTSVDMLDSLAEDESDVGAVTEFILRVIYNRPMKEKTPGQSRYAMLFVKKKGKKKKFADTKRLPPDVSSLEMKIKRANYVTLGMSKLIICISSYKLPVSKKARRT